MALFSVDRRLAPGLGAALAGFFAAAIWDDPLNTIMSASAGALAAALAFIRSPSDTKPIVRPEPAREEEPQKANGLAPGQGRALLERLPMGVILIDRRATITFANDQANEIFGISRLIDQPSSSLRAPRLVEAIDAGVSDGLSGSVQFSLSRAQDIHLRAYIRPLEVPAPADRQSRGPTVLVVIEDVTQAIRTVALHRDFVANASHELKTPLSSITGIIQTLLGHARDDPEASERFLNMMSSQTDRMKRLVEDLLSLNRIELNERIAPRDPQPVRRIVWEVADALRQIAEENGMALEVDDASEHPYVLGSREELAQVFRNLIDNAIKYGREGTAVTIAVEPDSPERQDMIGISITDHGPGIAREHIPRLTERFYRVSVSRSREKGGTGLGLAIVKHILNRHRGDLEIVSTVGKGSTFTVWLPIAERSRRALSDQATAA
ncbi:MAG: ATP-binding protein [Pseudomonadota bacterium]